MVVKVICFDGDLTAHVMLFLFYNNWTRLCKKNLKFDDVTHNDVLGFDSRLLFLSADILTQFHNVSIETQSVISDRKVS